MILIFLYKMLLIIIDLVLGVILLYFGLLVLYIFRVLFLGFLGFFFLDDLMLIFNLVLCE